MLHPEDGAFGEYVTAKGDILMKIPDSLSFEEAATMPIGVLTCVQALYQTACLPRPGGGVQDTNGKKQILIYGGSTATGMHAIQFAKL